MNCPNCDAELKLEGEFLHSGIDLDIDTAAGSVTIIFTCAACIYELGEYDFELEQDISDFAQHHEDEEDHELSVDLGDEAYDEHVDDKGTVYPGAVATVKVSCICGGHVEYQWSNYDDPVEVMKELCD